MVVFVGKSQNSFCRKSRLIGSLRSPDARAGKKEGGGGEGIFARPRFPPPPNFVPVKLARRLGFYITCSSICKFFLSAFPVLNKFGFSSNSFSLL